MHVGCALTTRDVSEAEIKEILLQQAIYCGVPAAHRAFYEVADDCPDDPPVIAFDNA